MATLTQPDDTGTLDRAAVLDAARTSPAPTPGQASNPSMSPEAIDQHAAELLRWLDAHGTIDDAELARRRATDEQVHERTATAPRDASVLERPGILVHQHVWLPTPERWEPTPHRSVTALVDEALAPLARTTHDGFAPITWSALVPRPQVGARAARSRTLGWAAVVGIWAAAAALLVPLAIWATVGAFDMTVDLSGSDSVAEAGADATPVAVENALGDG